MRKLLTVGMAAATLAGSLAWSTTAAADHRHRHYRDRDNTGAVVAAGVLGLALGAAVAGNNNGRYHAPPPRAYYRDPYYGRGYAYRCRVVTRWDPYYGRYVRYERCR